MEYKPSLDNYELDEDKIAEQEKKKEKIIARRKIRIIVVAVVAVVVGLVVFFVSYALLSNNNKTNNQITTDVTLTLTSERVTNLYKLVTYGEGGIRNNKYISNAEVTLKDFTNDEKYYYALMYASSSDFLDTGAVDTSNNKIYALKKTRMDQLMKKYFGSKVTYETSGEITHTFDFVINNGNTVDLSYDEANKYFKTIITSKAIDQPSNLIDDYYTMLYKATRKANNDILLEEKIIYVTYTVTNDIYTYNVYQDYAHTKLITTISNVSKDELTKNKIVITDDRYYDKASTITYTFKLDNKLGTYYFYSSKISN